MRWLPGFLGSFLALVSCSDRPPEGPDDGAAAGTAGKAANGGDAGQTTSGGSGVGQGGTTSTAGNTGSSGSAGRGGDGGNATGGNSGGGAIVPGLGQTALLIGQSGRRAHLDYVAGTQSLPAGGSVYAELYTGKFLSFEQAAFVDYLARYYPGSFVEVGLSWKDNRVNAGYCDLADAACRDKDGAIAPELDIVAGKYDAALDAFAATMKSYAGLTFLVRVDYEVSPGMHCAAKDKDACPAYVDAFRYLRARFAKASVPNVQLVYHPTRGWAKQLYPGKDVTDWIAFSVFNHDLCLPTPEGENGGCKPGAHLDENLASDLSWAAEQGKPLLIAESTVQKPSDESAEGFNEYLSRLLEIVSDHPEVRGLTYINMKWSGGWIYGEDWTQGAFGNVDARLTHFPATRKYFCDTLDKGRFLGVQGAHLNCDTFGVKAPAVPPDLDSPAYDRLVLLGNNRCARAKGAEPEGGDALVQSDCGKLSESGQARFRITEQAGVSRIWSDWSWQCWSAEGDQVVQRPCDESDAQRFELKLVRSSANARDVRLVAEDGRCVSTGAAAPLDAPLVLAACSDAEAQVFRL